MRTMLNITIAAVSIGLSVHAADTPSQGNVLTFEERAARRAQVRKIVSEKSGGFLSRPGTPTGAIYYVNCQKRVPKEWIVSSMSYFQEETKFDIAYVEGTFNWPRPEVTGNASLFIIDDDNMPAMLFAPEDSWIFINVAVIGKEKRPVFFEMRTKKQLSRAFALLCGASNSQYPRALTRGIINEDDLDKNPDPRLPVDVIARFQSYMEPLGVRPRVLVSYRKAVQEGWAPAPTNDVQKAIWDKVHAMPTEPIKIKPETKKVQQ